MDTECVQYSGPLKGLHANFIFANRKSEQNAWCRVNKEQLNCTATILFPVLFTVIPFSPNFTAQCVYIYHMIYLTVADNRIYNSHLHIAGNVLHDAIKLRSTRDIFDVATGVCQCPIRTKVCAPNLQKTEWHQHDCICSEAVKPSIK